MQSMPTFLQAWIENQISNLSYAKNLFLQMEFKANNNFKTKKIMIQICHKKITSCCNLLWWFASNVWLWVGQEPY
jgi:predicted lactoylglutathione lyase